MGREPNPEGDRFSMSKSHTPVKRRERPRAELIGLQDAADRCGISYRTIRRYIAAGHLNAVRIGPRLLKIDAADLAKITQPVGGGAAR